MLHDARESDHKCLLPNGETLEATLCGSVHLQSKVGDEVVDVTLSEVHYAECLPHNLMSYGLLEEKGCRIEYDGVNKFVQTSGNDRVFQVGTEERVLVVRTSFTASDSGHEGEIEHLYAAHELEPAKDHEDSLMNFHIRLGHLCYDSVERLAKTPGSGIKLTDRSRPQCLTCANGKQAKSAQPKTDSGANAPIDRIGGVICSDIKGPMTPRDRNGNRYMISFVDHKSNYCRVFLAKTKSQAADMFQHFMAFFERQFNCKIHILRTDGGKEYTKTDIFCKYTGIGQAEDRAVHVSLEWEGREDAPGCAQHGQVHDLHSEHEPALLGRRHPLRLLRSEQVPVKV